MYKLFPLEVVQKCQYFQLCVLRENSIWFLLSNCCRSSSTEQFVSPQSQSIKFSAEKVKQYFTTKNYHWFLLTKLFPQKNIVSLQKMQMFLKNCFGGKFQIIILKIFQSTDPGHLSVVSYSSTDVSWRLLSKVKRLYYDTDWIRQRYLTFCSTQTQCWIHHGTG